jgi:hypothetical protein
VPLTLKSTAVLSVVYTFLDTSRLDFTFDGCRFIGFKASGKSVYNFLLDSHGYSVDDIFSARAGQISASRVALFDMSKRQARALRAESSKQSELFTVYTTLSQFDFDWKKSLKDDQYKLLNDPETEKAADQESGA